MKLIPVFFSISFALLSANISIANEQQNKLPSENPAEQTEQAQEIPQTLDQAHEQLEKLFPPEELALIDEMPSEKDMIRYHFSTGMWIRNNWGLRRGSALAKHLNSLGFTHPDDMSSIILETFWFKRHGKDFDQYVEQQAADYKTYWENVRKESAAKASKNTATPE